jgi:hypothetical protein
MPGKGCAKWMALSSVIALAGCCSWCERNCSQCHAPAPVAAASPCVPCCAAAPAPVAVSYQQPAPAPAGQWQRTYPQMNCTCTPAN